MTESQLEDEPILSARVRRRLALALAVLLALLLLAIVPPLISVRRYQRRVVAAISGSIGRPVHFDDISIHVLPFPGFTIQNFVVSERIEFGAEPVLRADTVQARLRLSSLWRRRVEISRISLEAPHINLVRNAAGRWNVQSIVTQASQLNSAPTAQPRAGEAPRFPYIEASDARVNIKQGQDKLPFTLTGAEFSLWLSQPGEWHLRFAGQPTRTDTDVSDTGALRVEATLGRAANLPDAKIDLHATWKPTPLGQATLLTLGDDLHWRGDISAGLNLNGTLGAARTVADIHVHDLRRADFVPARALNLDAHCEALATGVLHALRDVRCALPTAENTSMLDAFALFRERQQTSVPAPDVLSLKAEIPDTADWRTADLQMELQRGSPNYLLDWMRLFSQRIPANLTLGGTGSLALTRSASTGTPGWTGALVCECILPPVPAAKPGQGTAAQPNSNGAADAAPAATAPPSPNHWTVRLSHSGAPMLGGDGFISVLAYPSAETEAPEKPETAPLGTILALQEFTAPGNPAISGRLTRAGYQLHYASAEVAARAAALLPPLGDGMPAGSATAPLTATRTWYGPQTWTDPAPAARKQDTGTSPHRTHRR